MLITKQGYRRKYVVGGRGIFDTVRSLLGRVYTSAAAKTLGKKAATAATNAAIKGVEKGATKAVDHLVSKIPPPKARNSKLPPKAAAILSKHEGNIHNLIAGAGIARVHTHK